MRTVTYNAGAYLVEELQAAGVVGRFLHDGGDIILFENRAGQKISIHLIESSIELYEIRAIVADNTANDIYTLFILWGDRLLPGDGQRYGDEDWLRALVALYDGQVYAYDIYGLEIFVFPIHFGADRRVRYGTTVHMAHLGCATVTTGARAFAGVWRAAHFGAARTQHDAPPETPRPVSVLAACYALLGVDEDDSREVVKKAYRLLARRYHPDLNRAADATVKMQQINAAYDTIMAQLDEREM